jgi:hypothetical protein
MNLFLHYTAVLPNFLLGFNRLVKCTFHGTVIFTVRVEPVGVVAYRRIVVKVPNVFTFLSYTGVKVVMAYFMPDRPDAPCFC